MGEVHLNRRAPYLLLQSDNLKTHRMKARIRPNPARLRAAKVRREHSIDRVLWRVVFEHLDMRIGSHGFAGFFQWVVC